MIYANWFIESHPLRPNDLKQHLHKKEKLQKLISLCIPQHWIHMWASMSYQKLKEKYGSLKHKRLSSYGGEEWVFRGQRHAYNGEDKQKHPKMLKVETRQQIKFSNVGLKKRIKDGGWGEWKRRNSKTARRRWTRAFEGAEMLEQTKQPSRLITPEADRQGKGKPTRTNKPKMAKNNIQRSRFVVDGMRPESERRTVDEMEQRHRSSSGCAHRDKHRGNLSLSSPSSTRKEGRRWSRETLNCQGRS